MTRPLQRHTIRLLVILGFALHGLGGAAHGFGGAGPQTHLSITEEALRRYTAETGWEVDALCAAELVQASVISDSRSEAPKWQLHCDNNDLVGCSFRLDKFKGEANRAPVREDALSQMGRALHIVQDFYAHSNYVEQVGFSMILAPLQDFKDFPPPRDLQTGYFPDRFPDFNAQLLCFLAPETEYRYFIYGATHACLNKDSAQTPRGGKFITDGFGVRYHELASEYAILASVQLLRYFGETTPWFRTCLQPYEVTRGRHNRILGWTR